MEARMLSLFDDEDFLPQEKPKPVKPKKSLSKKEEVIPEAVTEEKETSAEQTADTKAIPETPAAQETMPDPAAEQAQETKTTATETPEAGTEAVLPGLPAEQEPEAAIAPEAAQPVQDTTVQDAAVQKDIAETETEEEANPAAAPEAAAQTGRTPEDEELDRQILSEIMLNDYSALIHKDYPFDFKSAEVVKKDKEIKVPPTVKQIIARTEAPQEIQEEEEEDDSLPAAPLPEWNLDKRYYTIGEVSQLFRVNTSHIRFWTNEFKLRPRTTRKGDRLYSPEDIARLRLIHHLVKEKKHTIKGAKEKLKAEKEAVGNKLDLKDSLISLKEMLVQIKEQL